VASFALLECLMPTATEKQQQQQQQQQQLPHLQAPPLPSSRVTSSSMKAEGMDACAAAASGWSSSSDDGDDDKAERARQPSATATRAALLAVKPAYYDSINSPPAEQPQQPLQLPVSPCTPAAHMQQQQLAASTVHAGTVAGGLVQDSKEAAQRGTGNSAAAAGHGRQSAAAAAAAREPHGVSQLQFKRAAGIVLASIALLCFLLLLPEGWLLLLQHVASSVGEMLLQLAAAGWVAPADGVSGVELLLLLVLLAAAAALWGLTADRQQPGAAP
jgi:hypothetical protein